MTILKIYKTKTEFFFINIKTRNMSFAVRQMWKLFGETVKYDVVAILK